MTHLSALAQLFVRVATGFLPGCRTTSRHGIRINVSRNGTCSVHPADLEHLVRLWAPSPGSCP